ncbi:MAG: hypothetical protein K6E38_03345 [Fretibacterium sp.]|nr:hypothetical protein [Fretibacterium sp.]
MQGLYCVCTFIIENIHYVFIDKTVMTEAAIQTKAITGSLYLPGYRANFDQCGSFIPSI